MASKQRMLTSLLFFFTCNILQTNSEASNIIWWCGANRAEAETKCLQSCPTGHGCPSGTVCFSGITSCSSNKSNSAVAAAAASSASSGYYCGATLDDANANCNTPCPSGGGCPMGEACWMYTSCGGSGSASSSSSIIDDLFKQQPSSSTSSSSSSYTSSSSGNYNNNNNGGSGISSSWSSTPGSSWSSSSSGSPGSSSSGSSSASFTSTTTGGSNSNNNNNNNYNNNNNAANLVNSPAGLTGTAAVEQTFLQMKDVINSNLFLYETPMMAWVPSTVYRFDGFFDGMKIMHSEGVAGKRLYLGPRDDEDGCAHCHMYGLVNVAAFLAQAMKETIRYDACDENSWDRVGVDLMYPISNACGQLGQSYQDYHCSEEEKHMECEVDPQMTITAVTNARWWGAPGPLQCGPKSLYPQTGHWDYYYNCDNIWADPPETCDAYEGQKGGKAINDVPYPNTAGRTDVEGCCWWGRGVIQTSGVCNFGKLNYFLGKRAADDGRESRYPNIDFCRDPEAICSSQEHLELKWIAGLFYWISDVQQYDSGGWNYLHELHKFVDNGMEGDAFINAVSGIVNRGCHNPPCGTGELDGGPERAQNFFDVVKEMKFSFVDVDPQAVPPPPTEQLYQEPSPGTPTEMVDRSLDRYTCGDGYQSDASDTSISPSSEVAFDYEVHNGIDVAVGDALRDVKGSILSDIAERMGCQKTWSGRDLQQSSGGFDNIVALQSKPNDLPDPDAAGCMVGVETDDPSTCTPVSGGFTIHGKPGTSQSSMRNTINSLKGIIESGMGSGRYESNTVMKAIYIGDRDNVLNGASTPTIVQSDSDSNEGIKIAIWVLACTCLLLLCLLCFTIWTYREKVHEERRRHDEEMAFNHFMMENEENKHTTWNSLMTPQQVRGYDSQHKKSSPPRGSSQNRNRQGEDEWNEFEFEEDYYSDSGEYPPQPMPQPRSSSKRASMERPTKHFQPFGMNESDDDRSTVSESSPESVEDITPIATQLPPVPQSRSAPRFDTNSHQMTPSLFRGASSEGGSVSSSGSSSGSSGSSSGGSSSDNESFNDGEQKVPAAPVRPTARAPPRRPTHGDNNGGSPGYGQSIDSLQNSSSSGREARQRRMAEARARAAKRQLS